MKYVLKSWFNRNKEDLQKIDKADRKNWSRTKIEYIDISKLQQKKSKTEIKVIIFKDLRAYKKQQQKKKKQDVSSHSELPI